MRIYRKDRDVTFTRYFAYTLLLFMLLHILSLFRLIGVSGIPSIILSLCRGLDIFLILFYIFLVSRWIHIRAVDFVLLIFATYPIFTGAYYNGISTTYINDAVLYLTFTAKIVAIRSAILRLQEKQILETVISRYSGKIVKYSAVISTFTLFFAISLYSVQKFYFQAPSEYTLASAIVLTQGNILMFSAFLIISVISAKRMITVGLLAMLLTYCLTSRRGNQTALKIIAVLTLLTMMVLFLTPADHWESDPAAQKMIWTFERISQMFSSDLTFNERLITIAPDRFIEYISVKPYLTDYYLFFGHGYGFRYELNPIFLDELGYDVRSDITNAHFTPLAIVIKFGLLGLGIWAFVLFRAFTTLSAKGSTVVMVARLALVSMVFQSFFAFGFFLNLFTPFYLAIATMGVSGSKPN